MDPRADVLVVLALLDAFWGGQWIQSRTGRNFLAFSVVRNCLRTAEDDRDPTVKLQQRLATYCDGIDTMCIVLRAQSSALMILQWAIVS